MERLPQELVLDILSSLPIPSLVKSQCVCRAWRIIIRDQVLVNKHSNCMSDNDPTFVLQISDQAIQNNLYFGDLSSDQDNGNVTMFTKKLPMPPLLNFHLVSSCNGLLCLRRTHPTFGLICIYNPFTRDYIELPELVTEHSSPHMRFVGFGFDPTAKKHKVVEISYKLIISYGVSCCRFVRSDTRRVLHHPRMVAAPSSSSIESEVNVLSVGSPTWRHLGKFPFHIMVQQSQVLVNGKLHWITYNTIGNNSAKRIMSFDLTTEQFKEVPRPDSIGPDRHIHELVVLRGCLSTVSFNNDTKELEIWIMLYYDVKESWVKEFSIGAYVPKALQSNDQRQTLNSSKFFLPKKHMRVLCMLSSGRILLESNNESIVLYDSHCRTFNDLRVTFEGIPRYFRAILT